MKRKFSLLLVIAIAMSLFVGCGKNDADSKGSESDTDAIQDTEENTESVESEATVITDVFTHKKLKFVIIHHIAKSKMIMNIY